MSVVDVALALFILITEFSKVRVSGSSWDGFKTLKFLGSNLESSMNSPVRISLTSLAGSSCTESIAGSLVEQFSGLTLITGKDVCSASFPEESLACVGGAVAGGDEPMKALTAASRSPRLVTLEQLIVLG